MPIPSARLASVDAAKARLLKGIVARKKADYHDVSERGKDVLSFLRRHAKRDMLAVEMGLFQKFDFDTIVDDVVKRVAPESDPEE